MLIHRKLMRLFASSKPLERPARGEPFRFRLEVSYAMSDGFVATDAAIYLAAGKFSESSTASRRTRFHEFGFQDGRAALAAARNVASYGMSSLGLRLYDCRDGSKGKRVALPKVRPSRRSPCTRRPPDLPL
jgi:hypothetical protein